MDAPSEVEVEHLLELAGVAAHASERTAAPVSCWLAATADLSLQEALSAARRLALDPGFGATDETPAAGAGSTPSG